jgi:protein-tyrosine-phosphatase/DNA-binding transcriptional ArsR family regulator
VAGVPTPVGLQTIADPQRWALLSELARSDRRVSELTRLVDEPQNLVSYHLRELRDAGLVSSRRSSHDGRDAYYRVDLARCADVLTAAAAALGVVPPPPTRSRGRKPKVLFLCTGNSARSQMAEALLIARSGGAFDARSAGSAPKPLHPDAVRVMAERGIDISRNKTKHYDKFTHMHFDRVVTLCDKVREVCPEYPGAIHWSTPEPTTYEEFVAVADDLDVRIRHLSVSGGQAHG